MKILILGGKGNLGQDLMRAFGVAGHECEVLDHQELNMTDSAALRQHILSGGYGAVINAAARNDVDAQENEDNQAAALALNAVAPGVAAAAARDAGAKFVHYSTDYVFSGQKGNYAEDDEPDPVSFYGRGKAMGEQAVREAGGSWYVCRLSKLFGRPGSSSAAKPSFVNIMLKLSAEKPELKIVDEEIGSPTYTHDVAEATVALIAGDYAPGIYHMVNEGPGVTWYGFAEEFFSLLGIDTPRTPVSSAEFARPARRPTCVVLRNTKFPTLRPRTDALQAYFADCPEVVPDKFRVEVES